MTTLRNDILKSKEKIFSEYYDTELYRTPFRFALEIYHRTLFRNIPLRSPSLELGISNGIASSFIFSDRGKIDWGTDMPVDGIYSSNTIESHGAVVRPEVKHYGSLLGADGQNIPFPDNSFATVICNEVLGQGMDRLKMLKEMVRVLAPGGMLAFTENTSELKKYPPLLERIENFNPNRGKTVGVSWYLEKLESLGMSDLRSFQFMNSSFGVALMYLLFSAKFQPPEINDSESKLYKLFLESMLPVIEGELAEPKKIKDGMHLFICAKKMGKQSKALKLPQPCCIECGGIDFLINEKVWSCQNSLCGAEFEISNGVPLLISKKNIDEENQLL